MLKDVEKVESTQSEPDNTVEFKFAEVVEAPPLVSNLAEGGLMPDDYSPNDPRSPHYPLYLQGGFKAVEAATAVKK